MCVVLGLVLVYKFFTRMVTGLTSNQFVSPTLIVPISFIYLQELSSHDTNKYFLLFSLQIEDEGNHGNDETRLFILSSLAAQHKSRVACVLCEEPMLVFDRYPLVDGTFFLSPRRHANGCIEVSSSFWNFRLVKN